MDIIYWRIYTMQFALDGSTLKVTREQTDTKRYSRGGWGSSAESALLYDIKKALTALGFADLIKKQMWKDGHLTADTQHYLRTRNHRSKGPHVYIHDGEYQIRDLAEDWKIDGYVRLEITWDVYERQGIETSKVLFRALLAESLAVL